MTVCEVCGEIDMNTILDVCRDCQRERDEYKEIAQCDDCGQIICKCDFEAGEDDDSARKTP